MSKEVRVHVTYQDGKPVCYIDRIDKENKIFETMNPTGEWVMTGLYEENKYPPFAVSINELRNTVLKADGVLND